jgi:hypothetical protein
MKFGGRQKGTPNKVTKEIRESFLALVNKHLVNDIENLPPKERFNALIRLLPYIVPPAKDIDAENEPNNEPLIIILERDNEGNEYPAYLPK